MTALCGSVTDAEEAVQEAFARGLGMTGRRPPPDDPQGWLYRVASNVVKARWRRLKVAQRLWPRLATREKEVSPVDGSDDRLSLVAAMRRLPVEQREALALHYFADMPVAAIAHRIEVPVGTVKARLSRGRDSLASQLALDAWPSPGIDQPVDAGAVRQPSFSVVEGRRARRSRRGAIGAAVITSLVLAGAAWGGSRLPPPITPTPTPSATSQPTPSPDPTTSASPSPEPQPDVAAGPTNESIAVSPTGTVFVLRRECVTACTLPATSQTTERLVLFRSADLGRTWTRGGTIPAGIGIEGRLAVSDDSVMWIINLEKLWGTTDGGKTWRDWPIALTAGLADARGGRLWFGTESGLMVATAGKAPVPANRGLPGDRPSANQIVARTGDAATVLIERGEVPAQWYRSDDKGVSWRLMTQPCAGVQLTGQRGNSQPEEFRTLMGATRDGNVLWAICTNEPAAGQDKAVVISLDGGRTWKAAQGQLEYQGNSFLIQPVSARIAWRHSFEIIYRTEDARTWTAVTPTTVEVALGFAVIDGDTAILMDRLNVYSTNDGGKTWATNPLPR